jgi:hypothetical protein
LFLVLGQKVSRFQSSRLGFSFDFVRFVFLFRPWFLGWASFGEISRFYRKLRRVSSILVLSEREGRPASWAQGPEGDAYSCRKGRPVLSLYIYLLFHIPSLAQGGKAELRDRMWA